MLLYGSRVEGARRRHRGHAARFPDEGINFRPETQARSLHANSHGGGGIPGGVLSHFSGAVCQYSAPRIGRSSLGHHRSPGRPAWSQDTFNSEPIMPVGSAT